MNKRLGKVLLVILMCIFLMPTAKADASSVSVSYDKKVGVGETFYVTIKYTGDNLSRVIGEFKYNPEIIKYISGGNSEGNGGIVLLKKAAEDNGDLTFKLKFEATAKGHSTLETNTTEIYDKDESSLSPPKAQKSVITIDGTTESKESVFEDSNSKENIKTDDVDDSVSEKLKDTTNTPTETIIFYSVIIFVLLVILCTIILITRKHRKKNKQ